MSGDTYHLNRPETGRGMLINNMSDKSDHVQKYWIDDLHVLDESPIICT